MVTPSTVTVDLRKIITPSKVTLRSRGTLGKRCLVPTIIHWDLPPLIEIPKALRKLDTLS